MNFESLGLDLRILKALKEKGYTTPSPIQQQAIPVVLAGRDLLAAAQTGTGKTAGFTLPMLQNLLKGQGARNNSVRALVLTPTRELAQQVADNVALYSKHLPIKSAVVYGGVKINPQMQKLRGGADVLVATPGRLLDLYQQNALKLDRLEILVLDEADRMLDMGFIHDLKKIVALIPKKRQTLLFSATFSNPIKELAERFVIDPQEVSVSPANTKAPTISHTVFEVDKSDKTKLLIHLIKQEGWRQVLVFSKTKHGANRIAKMLLAKDISAAAIHGDKSQNARTKALADFKAGSVQVLVATDIAARGIDISQLPYVVNFDLPKSPRGLCSPYRSYWTGRRNWPCRVFRYRRRHQRTVRHRACDRGTNRTSNRARIPARKAPAGIQTRYSTDQTQETEKAEEAEYRANGPTSRSTESYRAAKNTSSEKTPRR